DGYLYPPNFADVIVRDPVTLDPLPPGKIGVLQVLSALPRGYPGHSLLTEDLGVVHHLDEPTCGRMGKAFSVVGRIPRAELRGCSDVIAAQVAWWTPSCWSPRSAPYRWTSWAGCWRTTSARSPSRRTWCEASRASPRRS